MTGLTIWISLFLIMTVVVLIYSTKLERITEDPLWFTWKVIAIEPVVTTTIGIILLIPFFEMAFLLWIPILILSFLYGRSIYRRGYHALQGRIALAYLIFRTVLKMSAIGLFWWYESSVPSVINADLFPEEVTAFEESIWTAFLAVRLSAFGFTSCFLVYQLVVIRNALKGVRKKEMATVDLSVDWIDDETLIKQLKDNE